MELIVAAKSIYTCIQKILYYALFIQFDIWLLSKVYIGCTAKLI